MLRARQTCQFSGLTPTMQIEPDLTEWDVGDYEGLTSVDIGKRRPDLNIFKDGCPGGEMPFEVTNRDDRSLDQLRMLEGNIALFSYGQFGRVLAARWVGLQVIAAQHF